MLVMRVPTAKIEEKATIVKLRERAGAVGGNVHQGENGGSCSLTWSVFMLILQDS